MCQSNFASNLETGCLCQNGMVRQDLCAGRAASGDLYVLSDRQEGGRILVFPQVTQGGLAVARMRTARASCKSTARRLTTTASHPPRLG